MLPEVWKEKRTDAVATSNTRRSGVCIENRAKMFDVGVRSGIFSLPDRYLISEKIPDLLDEEQLACLLRMDSPRVIPRVRILNQATKGLASWPLTWNVCGAHFRRRRTPMRSFQSSVCLAL